MKFLIIGLGLIGGSIAKRIKSRWEDAEIVGFDLNPEVLTTALNRQIIDQAADSLRESIPQSEIIIWALPIKATCKGIKEFREVFKPGQLITDVTSAKQEVMKAAQHLPEEVFFIGGHPMAGKEKSGLVWSDPDLFTGRPWVLITDEQSEKISGYAEAFATLERVVLGIGAIPISMSALEHDRSVALLSHLPQIVSSCLMNTIGDYLEEIPTNDLLAAGGFKDTTRIAGSNPKMWQEICLANRQELIKLLGHYETWLHEARRCLETNDSHQLLKLLETAKARKTQIAE